MGKTFTALGQQFKSMREAANFFNLPYKTVFYRKRYLHWTNDKAVTTPVEVQKKTCRDYKGREFPSIAAMCKAYGISYFNYRTRICEGWGLKRALTAPITKRKGKVFVAVQVAVDNNVITEEQAEKIMSYAKAVCNSKKRRKSLNHGRSN